MTPADIIKTARRAVGVPFKHQGRDLKGLDCAGLLIWTARELGIEHFDHPAYSRRPLGQLLQEIMDGQPALVRVARKPVAGDVLLMRFTKEPQHVALCAGDTVIHSYEAVGKVCEHRLDDEWRRRIVRVYQFSGVEQ